MGWAVAILQQGSRAGPLQALRRPGLDPRVGCATALAVPNAPAFAPSGGWRSRTRFYSEKIANVKPASLINSNSHYGEFLPEGSEKVRVAASGAGNRSGVAVVIKA